MSHVYFCKCSTHVELIFIITNLIGGAVACADRFPWLNQNIVLFFGSLSMLNLTNARFSSIT